MTRDERQKECVKKWAKNRGLGTVVGATGFGKTRVGLQCARLLRNKFPELSILVVVPTTALQKQWVTELNKYGIAFNYEVIVINTVVKHKYNCGFLIIDEAHRMASDLFSNLFNCVTYKFALGLSATFERLDGKEKDIAKFIPVVDTVAVAECLANGWISKYHKYVVYLDVDLEPYKELNREFTEHFEFFGFDGKRAMSMVGKDGMRNKCAWRDIIYQGDDKTMRSNTLRLVNMHALGFTRTMQGRKKFINSHPKKIKITNKIIEKRFKDHKIITFSHTVDMAKQIQRGEVFTSKTATKKRSADMIDAFSHVDHGVLNTVAKANEGLDVKGLSVGIILGMDSSHTKAIQRLGRVIRAEEGKTAELFILVIKGTVEEKWFQNNNPEKDYTIIDESQLDDVLDGRPIQDKRIKQTKISFRF